MAKGIKLGKRGGKYANSDQQKMAEAWRSKAWKERRAELLGQQPRCEWCNGASTVINHRRQGFYEGYTLCRREEIDIICQPCHEHWTKTGQKRQRLWDDCASCPSMIYVGRKTCYSCGGKEIISKSDRTSEQKATLVGILNRCPDVQVGQRWKSVWLWPDEVEVTGLQPQELPWPMVMTSMGEVGLPAFIFGTLVD
jgi:hypothetical protein